ncbi:hypothetical protein ZWY2020_039914 [Hordeum vulgare]|nr:hypothetical protein ZWY2020_039914 [Hordeum vulgare]
MESSPRPEPKPSDQEGQAKERRSKEDGSPFLHSREHAGLGLAINGTTSNLQIYLIKQYNVDSIDAAQIANIVRGSLNFVPVAGAILSDSYLGCFRSSSPAQPSTFWCSLCCSLSQRHCCPATAALPGAVRRVPARNARAACRAVRRGLLLAIGTGGTRFNVATMGADQFGGEREQDTFFNWYFVFLSASFLVGDTAIVYIQDGVSWALGFGVCLPRRRSVWPCFSLGARYYRMPRQRQPVLRAGPRRRGRCTRLASMSAL